MSQTSRHLGGHLDEMSCLLYLEGQLERERAAALVAHAAGCGECRALLQALERESAWLGEALREESEALPAGLRTPAEESAEWPWAVTFALAATAAYALWTGFLEPAASVAEQTGIQASGLLAALLFGGAFWEGWQPMLETAQYAVLICLGAGTLLLARRWAPLAIVLATLGLTLGAPPASQAADIRRGRMVTVEVGDTVDNDLIAAGNRIRVDGTVAGDVIAAGEEVTVTGHVAGDLIAFAQTVRVEGEVDGNVRCFCNRLQISDTVAKNLSAFAANVEIARSATVGGGMIGFTRNTLAEGRVNRDLLLFSGETTLAGPVGGNVLLRGGRLTVGPTAELGGRLQVRSEEEPQIAEGARLAMPLEFERFAPPRGPLAAAFLARQILAYGAAFLCGLLLLKLFPGLFEAGRAATRRVGLAVSVGALVLVAGAALTVLAILLLLAGTGAGLATLLLYGPVLYGAQVFVGMRVGERVASARPALAQLAIGLLILRVLGILPLLGLLVWAAVAVWGTGAVCIALWNRTRAEMAVPATA